MVMLLMTMIFMSMLGKMLMIMSILVYIISNDDVDVILMLMLINMLVMLSMLI